MATPSTTPICFASVHTVLVRQGVDAVMEQWPDLAQHRPLLEQVASLEATRSAAEEQERRMAAAVQRLMDQIQLRVG